jgi:hypothetical protein
MHARYPGVRGRGGLTALPALLLCAVAHAGLGGTLDSVQDDQQAFAASLQQSALSGATQYTLRQANGVTVRQYVSASGTVFGVGWDGPLLPDFKRLLGAHFAAFEEARRQPARRISLRSVALVIDAGGMMRSFSGRAYLPGQLPATLSGADIR